MILYICKNCAYAKDYKPYEGTIFCIEENSRRGAWGNNNAYCNSFKFKLSK